MGACSSTHSDALNVVRPVADADKIVNDLIHENQVMIFSKTFCPICKEAKAYFDKGKKASLWNIVFNPTWAFFKAYVLRLGFLDGFNGFVICVQTANITFLKYSKLRELYRLKN